MLPRKKKKIIKLIIASFIVLSIAVIILNVYVTNINEENITKAKLFDSNISQEISGITYYISSDGTSNNGTEINEPMSLQTAKTKSYKSGDKLLFKSGDIFYGQLSFSISATEKNPVIISSYGEGEKPIISVAKIITTSNVWEQYSDDIYRIDLTNNKNFEGYKGTDDNSCNIGFFTTGDGNIYGNRESSIGNLTNLYDFYCDGQYFYIKSTQNPTDALGRIKLSTKKDLLALSSNTEVSNLQLEYSSAHAVVKRSYPISNVYMHDCFINYIGGSYQNGNNASSTTRYGNAIEFWKGARNITIENNLIKNVYDAGITLQGNNGEWNNITIKNNIIINTCYPFEIWAKETSTGFENVNIFNNIVINQGLGWAQEVRDTPNISANYVFYYTVPTAKMDIKIYNNQYYNSYRLYYITEATKEKLINEIYNNENTYYINEDIYIVNNTKNSNVKDSLVNEYNMEHDSVFNYLSNTEIEEISNTDILNSSNYEEIKAYYDNFDIKYRNNNWAEEVLTELETIINQGDYAVILQNAEVETAYEELKNAIGNLLENVDTITVDNVSYSYECLYKFIEKIVDEYYNNKSLDIAENKLIELIEGLDKLSEKYLEIYSYYVTDDTIELETVKNTLNNTIDKYNNNLDLDITNLESIINLAKDIYNNSITTENTYENVLNKQRIINISNVVDSIIDAKISDCVEEEKAKIKVEYDKDIVAPTNEDITATVIIGEHTTITNNGGSNKYTFKQNGTFTFELDIKGTKVEVQVTIANINKDYTIENGYISNIAKNTQILDFKDNLGIKEFTITREGKTININEDIVATGDILNYDNKEYTLIVSGDINKDGDCGIHDLVSFRKYLLEYSTYDNLERMAADINKDDVLDIKDLVGIRKMILN